MKVLKTAWVIMILWLSGGPSARAEGRIYVEVGAGLSLISSSAEFFQAAAPDALGLGTALNAGAAIKLLGPRAPVDVHLGATYRYISGSDDTTAYALQAIYPFLRVVFRGRTFITLGVTPFLWKRIASEPGFDSPVQITGRMAYMLEGGYTWPITPAVALAASGSVHTSTGTGSTRLSPMPAFEAGGQLRFYFGGLTQADMGGGSDDASPMEGWRYPYGIPKGK